MNFDAILFDKDGTLIDFNSFWIKVAERTMEIIISDYGITRVSLDEFMKLIGVRDGVASVDGLLCCGTSREIGEEMHGLLKSRGYEFDLDELCVAVDRAFINSIDKGELKPTSPKLYDTLKELKAKGIKLAVVTNDLLDITIHCLKGIGVIDLFDKICVDDGKSPTKPNPYHANRLCEDWGLDKTRVLMVGDTATDVKFARNAGIKVAYLSSTEEGRESMRSASDFVMPDASHLLEVVD